MAKSFLEQGTPVGFGKILIQDLLSQMLPGFNMVLLVYNLKVGINFTQFHYDLSKILDFTSIVRELGVSPCILRNYKKPIKLTT